MMQQNNGFIPQPQPQNVQYQQPMQQQPAPVQQANSGLKQGSGTVIAVMPKLNQDGSQKQGQNNKGEFWQLYKIQVQCQNGQPSFSFFKKANNQLPQLGQVIEYKYSESPNPRGAVPMKTMVFFNQAQNVAQQPMQAPQQDFSQGQGVTPQQNNTDAQMQQWIQQAKQLGATDQQKGEVLGNYLLQFMANTKTVAMFNQLWGQQ